MEFVNQVAREIAVSTGNPHAVVNQVALEVIATLTLPPAPWIPEGGAPAFGTGVDPVIVLQISNDGGETWGNERAISLGKLGKTKTLLRWQRLGRSNNRVFRVICSEPVRAAIVAADLDTA